MNLLHVEGVRVNFGGVQALAGLDLEVGKGEIHGLIGPNGAGKTTALNTISGLVVPDDGSIRLGGEPLPSRSEEMSQRGLARTFQTPAMFEDLSAIENVVVGSHAAGRVGPFRAMLRTPRAIEEEAAHFRRAAERLDDVGFEFLHSADVTQLPFGALRKIELARALMSDPKLLLLDELNSGLSEDEVADVAAELRSIRDRTDGDVTIIIVEHDVPYVFGLCDRVTAMDRGATIATGTPSEVRSDPAVIASYLGESAPDEQPSPTDGDEPVAPEPPDVSAVREGPGEESLLRVEDLVVGYTGTPVLHDTHLTVQPGELVAIFGRNGAGKSTLLNSLMGNPAPQGGSVWFQGRRVEQRSTQALASHGLALVPQTGGVLPSQTVEDNLLLSLVSMRLPKDEMNERQQQIMERFPALASRRKQRAASLSGGERQMLAIARALVRKPALLMLDEPAAGLAPSIVDELQRWVVEFHEEGLAVLVAEQNISWVVPIASRAYILETGRIAAEGAPRDLVERGDLEAGYLGSTA